MSVIHTGERLSATIWSIGHSTRKIEDFIQLLKSNAIVSLLDVRSFPGSHRYPQFNKIELSQTLLKSGIDYHHLVRLGGRRKPSPDSRNTAWRNASFRAYADYMESNEFKEGIIELHQLARHGRTAIMCAKAVWWRCHRSLIADYLRATGTDVIHIVAGSRSEPHPYTAAARIVNGQLTYCGLFSE